ncbi:MAG TPA: hypothetical protein VNU68_23105 [Verrucomicrobiae bacterium]|nr:hypothetical protein [Verrucomicrobiae bacterium]
MRRPAPRLIGFRPLPVFTMELFTKLFGNLLAFVYHCFDRIVIHGYLSALSRPEQVVYFFRQVLGVPVVSKEILSQRTADYQGWVEAFARNHHTPIAWAEKGVRKEDHVLAWQRRMAKNNAYGVYFIFKSMEQGPTFRISMPKYPTKDPHYRILAHQRSRFTHFYFYIRDEVLGPMVMRVASFFPFQTTYYLNGHSFIEQELKRAQIGFRKNDNAFLAVDDVAALQAAADRLSPEIIRKRLDYWTLILGPKFSAKERKQLNLSRFYAISQIEYCRNFIFKRNFPIHKLFERSCELGLWRLTANKIAEIFGTRLHRRHRGKLATVIDQIEHGHHVFRAYFKSAFLKQYEKFSTFLRNELCSNNLTDFGLKKGLDHLDAVRQTFQAITDRFAGFQAQWLNVHVDFPLLQRIALPITIGSVRYPGIKIHDTRVIRLCEVLLHGGTHVGGWTANQIHQAVLTTFHLSDKGYSLNQLRYDLRKLRGHGLIERDGTRYAYRLTLKGVQVALLFLFFHKRLCGPLANSRFHHEPDAKHRPHSQLEAAYHRADKAINQIVGLLAAA